MSVNVEDLTIKELRELYKSAQAIFGDAPTSSVPSLPVKQIIVLDRGYVYVGDVTRDGDSLVVLNAKNIRRYGTTKGIGELRTGPTSNTVYDVSGTVRVPLRAVIHTIDVEGDGWNIS